MDKAGVKAASECLMRAKAALEAMEASEKLEDIQSAWSDFLTAANRIFSKLEQGAKATEKSTGWFVRKKYERKTDPFLCYIHHARNIDEHGIARVTEKTAGGLALGVGPGAWRFDGNIGPGGTMNVTALGGQVPGESKFAKVIPAKVRLIDVIDRGVKYEAPRGQGSKELTPIDVAKATLISMGKILKEAEELIAV